MNENVCDLHWIRSSTSYGNGECVELAIWGQVVAVRDSKDPDGPLLIFSRTEIGAFLEGVRRGDFDHLTLDK
jgi:Domain of unknown function (DUF397)